MTIAELRKEMGLTLGDFARKLGLTSKGYVFDMEKAERENARTVCSVRVALKLEELSEGKIRASDLNPDVGLVEQARGIAGEAA